MSHLSNSIYCLFLEKKLKINNTRFLVLPILMLLSFNVMAKSISELWDSAKTPSTCMIMDENGKSVDIFNITGTEINNKKEVIGYKVEHVDRSKINSLMFSLFAMSLSYGFLPAEQERIEAKKRINELEKELESMQPIKTYGSILTTEGYIVFKADGYLKRYSATVTLECK